MLEALGSLFGGAAGGGSGTAPNTVVFGSVNFKSPGAGDAEKSPNLGGAAAPAYAAPAAAPAAPWVAWAALGVAIVGLGLALLFALKRKKTP